MSGNVFSSSFVETEPAGAAILERYAAFLEHDERVATAIRQLPAAASGVARYSAEREMRAAALAATCRGLSRAMRDTLRAVWNGLRGRAA